MDSEVVGRRGRGIIEIVGTAAEAVQVADGQAGVRPGRELLRQGIVR